jgi:hypothetical protein
VLVQRAQLELEQRARVRRADDRELFVQGLEARAGYELAGLARRRHGARGSLACHAAFGTRVRMMAQTRCRRASQDPCASPLHHVFARVARARDARGDAMNGRATRWVRPIVIFGSSSARESPMRCPSRRTASTSRVARARRAGRGACSPASELGARRRRVRAARAAPSAFQPEHGAHGAAITGDSSASPQLSSAQLIAIAWVCSTASERG